MERIEEYRRRRRSLKTGCHFYLALHCAWMRLPGARLCPRLRSTSYAWIGFWICSADAEGQPIPGRSRIQGASTLPEWRLHPATCIGSTQENASSATRHPVAALSWPAGRTQEGCGICDIPPRLMLTKYGCTQGARMSLKRRSVVAARRSTNSSPGWPTVAFRWLRCSITDIDRGIGGRRWNSAENLQPATWRSKGLVAERLRTFWPICRRPGLVYAGHGQRESAPPRVGIRTSQSRRDCVGKRYPGSLLADH